MRPFKFLSDYFGWNKDKKQKPARLYPKKKEKNHMKMTEQDCIIFIIIILFVSCFVFFALAFTLIPPTNGYYWW